MNGLGAVIVLALAGIVLVDVFIERFLPSRPRNFDKEESQRRLMQELRRHASDR